MSIETKTARARLKVQGKPHWMKLSGGISLGYRRVQSGAGTWSVRIADGKGGGPIRKLGVADDLAPADGKNILDFAQARDAALRFAHTGDDKAAPVVKTLGEAVDAYEKDLEGRDKSPVNAKRLRKNLPPTMLKRPVALLTTEELTQWRNNLKARLQPDGVNRLMICLKAALNLAADNSKGLDREVWRKGLKTLTNARRVDNDVRPGDTVRALVHAARDYEENFGLLVEVLAQTGARYSQVIRCEVRDLLPDALMIPMSFKGKDKEMVPARVPLSADLVARLRLSAGDRPSSAPLLRKASGDRWGERDNIQRLFTKVVKAIGEDPAVFTAYSLRHTHITAQLLANLPVRLVASLHDTSVRMIELHYSHAIASHADDLVRDAMLQIDQPQANVVPLRAAQ